MKRILIGLSALLAFGLPQALFAQNLTNIQDGTSNTVTFGEQTNGATQGTLSDDRAAGAVEGATKGSAQDGQNRAQGKANQARHQNPASNPEQRGQKPK